MMREMLTGNFERLSVVDRVADHKSFTNVNNVNNVIMKNDDPMKEYDPDLPEEKFRVDRKKLEQMLLGYNVDVTESAENFFKRIMDATNTVITWPSKLKIGAKSKKDPHIKIYGKMDDISIAKCQIKAVLDTKTNRVTLKMDVAHTDHSHVIGRLGNNIRRVMEDTGCHIHFPDSNRSPNATEKSNQVSIAGQPEGVERARARIRGMLPLTFMFDLPVTGALQPLPDPTSMFVRNIEQKYDVKIQLKPQTKICGVTVFVRGSETWAQKVKDGTLLLIEHLTGTAGVCVPVFMTIEIALQHHAKVKELAESEGIEKKTNTSIKFPDAGDNKTTIKIMGNINGVYFARRYLMGCLPLVLLFDLKEDQELNHDLARLMHRFNVFISVKPKPRLPTVGVIMRGTEREAANLYEARRVLLNLEEQELPVRVESPLRMVPSSNGSVSVSHGNLALVGQNILTVNTANSMFHCPLSSPNFLPPSSNNAQTGGWSHGSYSECPSILLPHMPNQNAFPFVLETNYHGMNRFHPFSTVSSDTNSLSAPSSTTSSLSSPSQSPPRGSPIDNVRYENFGQNYSNEALMDLLLRRDGELLRAQNISALNVLAAISNMSRTTHASTSVRSESSDSGTSVPDKGLLSKSTVSFPPDYDHKKTLAAKAMKQKPEEPEVRVPTSSWSGYGFSHSMPESAIRELRAREELSFEMNGNLANDVHDIDKDPWKDCSKDMSNVALNALSPTVSDSLGDAIARKRLSEINLGSSNYIDSASLPPSSAVLGKFTDLADLFRDLGLTKYCPLFRQQEIELDTFVTLTDQDLKDLGITTFGARRKMLLAISSLNQQPSAFSMAPGAERKLSTTKKNSSSDSDGSPAPYWRS